MAGSCGSNAYVRAERDERLPGEERGTGPVTPLWPELAERKIKFARPVRSCDEQLAFLSSYDRVLAWPARVGLAGLLQC